MASVQTLMGSGIPGAAAIAIGVGTIELTKTATGTSSQANSYAIAADTTEFTSVAANSGARLPSTSEVGSVITIYNASGTAMFVYPETGGVINNGSVNAAITIAAGKGGQFTRIGWLRWGAVFA